MKLFLAIFIFMFSAGAHALDALVLVESSSFSGERLLSKVEHLIRPTELFRIDYSTDTPVLARTPFVGPLTVEANQLVLAPGDGYFIARSHTYRGKGAVLASADSQGRWRLSVMGPEGVTRKSKPAEVEDCSVLLHLMEIKEGQYVLAGIAESGAPMLRRWGGPGNAVEANLLKGQSAGEVSALKALPGGGLLAVVNLRNRTAELLQLDHNGRIVKKLPIAGGAANLGVDPDGRVLLTYRIGKTVFAQLLDSDFKSVWQQELYNVSGLASGTVQVVWLNDVWWLVGANTGQLFALNINVAGKVGTPILAQGNLLPPAEGQLHLAVERGILHLRGLSRTPSDLESNRMTAFHFQLK